MQKEVLESINRTIELLESSDTKNPTEQEIIEFSKRLLVFCETVSVDFRSRIERDPIFSMDQTVCLGRMVSCVLTDSNLASSRLLCINPHRADLGETLEDCVSLFVRFLRKEFRSATVLCPPPEPILA